MLAEAALEGLGELGDPAALADLIPLLDSPHAPLRKQAARALVWSSRPDTLDTLRLALPHDDPQVKYHAALGLACAGDASVASLVFSDAANKVLGPDEQTAAALALGASGEDRLVIALDDAKDEVRSRALLLLMMREWKDPQGTAARCLACLSSRVPRLRLTAARALELIADPAALGASWWASSTTGATSPTGRSPRRPWTTSPSCSSTAIPCSGPGRHCSCTTSTRTNRPPSTRRGRCTGSGTRGRSRHSAGGRRGGTRCRSSTARSSSASSPSGPTSVSSASGRAAKRRGQPSADPEATRVPQAALARILALAKEDPHHAAAARPVFLQG